MNLLTQPQGGGPPAAPAALSPDSFADAIRDLGERTPSGETSPKGASGPMQVLPSTASAPGFGVTPARDNSPEELTRVGRDYSKALLNHYGSPALAAAAYNAGPGMVDKWLEEFGDPRTGAVSQADWNSKIPFGETKGYVQRVAGGGGQQQPVASVAAPVNLQLAGAAAPTQAQAPATNPLAPPGVNYSQLLSMLHPTHTFTPVDYDPFAPGMPGAQPI